MKKIYIILIILAIPIIFIIYFFSTRHFFPQLSNMGLFGDMFGGINALFSGFAFLGIIYAIILQKKELRLQRKELELTRKELKRSAAAQENSQRELSKQAASLKATAKLNGLSSLLSFNTTIFTLATRDRIDFNLDKQSIIDEAKKNVRKIQDIVDKK